MYGRTDPDGNVGRSGGTVIPLLISIRDSFSYHGSSGRDPPQRGAAQSRSGRSPRSGRGGRRFKSCRPYHEKKVGL